MAQKAQRLQELANEKETLERDIFSCVAPHIEESYQKNDMKQVLDYINLMPEGSYMRMMSILRYDKHIKKAKENAGEDKA